MLIESPNTVSIQAIMGGTRPKCKECPTATQTVVFRKSVFPKPVNTTALDRCQVTVGIIEQDACHKKSHARAIKINSSKGIKFCCSVSLLISFLCGWFFLIQRSCTDVEMFFAVMDKSHYYEFIAQSNKEVT
jgi:hypothetical protein